MSGVTSESTIDRTVLPIRRPPFDGQTKETLERSVPDWNQAGHVQPPALRRLQDNNIEIERINQV